MVVPAGDHKLKVVVFVEGAEGGDQSLTGDLRQEARLLLKSAEWNRQASDAKQERDLDSGSPALFSLHDDASDDDNEFVERRSEQWNGMVSEVRTRGLNLCTSESCSEFWSAEKSPLERGRRLRPEGWTGCREKDEVEHAEHDVNLKLPHQQDRSREHGRRQVVR